MAQAIINRSHNSRLFAGLATLPSAIVSYEKDLETFSLKRKKGFDKLQNDTIAFWTRLGSLDGEMFYAQKGM